MSSTRSGLRELERTPVRDSSIPDWFRRSPAYRSRHFRRKVATIRTLHGLWSLALLLIVLCGGLVTNSFRPTLAGTQVRPTLADSPVCDSLPAMIDSGISETRTAPPAVNSVSDQSSSAPIVEVAAQRTTELARDNPPDSIAPHDATAPFAEPLIESASVDPVEVNANESPITRTTDTLVARSMSPTSLATSNVVDLPARFAWPGRPNSACSKDRSLETALQWAKSPAEAAEQARAEHKLVFLIHVSGNFEDPGFT